jgi:hypothetical protein
MSEKGWSWKNDGFDENVDIEVYICMTKANADTN